MDGLIKVAGFDDYYFNLKKMKMLSFKNGEYREIKSTRHKTELCWFLYKNGEKCLVRISEIFPKELEKNIA